MTTTDDLDRHDAMPPPRGTEEQPVRLLRRSRTDRVGVGVCGGLGEYFGVDPILFRVLFATAVFFGGSGVIAYLVAWAVIPEAGTQQAPIDGWMSGLRHRRVPVWVAAAAAGVVLWLLAFSWWSPAPFFPVVGVVVVLALLISRRDLRGSSPAEWDASSTATVNLRKAPPEQRTGEPGRDSADGAGNRASSSVAQEFASWLGESRAASKQRRRRALPVKIAALGTLVLTLVALAAADAVWGVPLVAYFWAGLGLVVGGLVVGVVLRRTPWSIAALLPLALAGVLAFAGNDGSLHDGVGQRTWTPTTPASSYRFGIGRATLDLRAVPPVSSPHTVRVTGIAGQLRILVPERLPVEVQGNVHIGQVAARESSGRPLDAAEADGYGASGTLRPPTGAGGARIVVDAHLADGQILVVRG